MSLSLTILIITISLIPLKIALFESTFAIILCTPVLAFLIGKYSSLTLSTYVIAAGIIYAFLYLSLYKRKEANTEYNLKQELIPLFIFILSLNFIFYLTQKWPDFIAIGERLRDFAILSSVIQSPIDVKEPWMAGYPLNYYAFWYRFGHFLSSAFNLKTWEVYHLLQSFTYALYFTTAFRLLSRYLNIKLLRSVFFSILICFGSNLAGVKDFVFGEPGWWGPSRVIPGAINEFPAWSFLLGDLHPHYLNLPLIPFFVTFFSCLYLNTNNLISRLLTVFGAFAVCYLWIGNSNVWEQPVWLLFAGIVIAYYIIEIIKKYWLNATPPDESSRLKLNYRHGLFLISIITLSVSLYLSKKNIITPDYHTAWVKSPVARTSLHDFCLHFGIPLFIITAASVLQVKDNILRFTAVALVFYFFFFTEALPLLIILLIINLIRMNTDYGIFRRKEAEISFKNVLLEATGIFSLSILMIPEIIFLDDPYGDDIQRMNTIFKIYSAAWFFIHVYAFAKLSDVFDYISAYCEKRSTKQNRLGAYALYYLLIVLPVLIFSTGFFVTTVGERTMKDQTIEPYSQGLSEISKLYMGSADIIKYLQTLPKGIVLEAQGKPYDYTSMISTLSEQPSFVGWTNHVNLLLSNNPEVSRREKLSDEFYNTNDCARKLEIIKNENISYVILGPLEKNRHGGISEEDFSCLKLVKSEQSFNVYSK